jgi:hypothetical protein
MPFSIAHSILAASACLLALGPANAAVQRTFVASYGFSANTAFNCSIAYPCRAFSEALSATASGGEVIVLDSAGYGPATITQSVSIIAPPGVYAGISVSTGFGILINAAGINVALRGLAINGLSPSSSDGIRVGTAGSVEIDRCVITNVGGEGIYVNSAAEVTVNNTVVRRISGDGITLSPGVDRATLTDIRVEENPFGHGLYTNNVTTLTVIRSVFVKNGGSGVHVGRTDGGKARATFSDSTISNNGSEGFDVFGNNSSRIEFNAARNEIIGNGNNGATFLVNSSALIAGLFTDNLISGNAANGLLANEVGVTLTATGNTIGSNVIGLAQFNGAVLQTRGNNVSENNLVAPTSGTITSANGY